VSAPFHFVSGLTTKLADRPGGRRLLDKVRAGDQVAFMAATAQAQAEATKTAQKAGIAYAKQQAGVKYRAGSRATQERSSRLSRRCSISIKG
jgi:DNA invertase Pin-like site-specific DNA recombinase